MSVGIPTRDLKSVLTAVKDALANPSLAERVLELVERNERVLESVRLEQSELAIARQEHARDLAKASQEQADRLQRERNEWAAEAQNRRRRLELDEYEAARRKEQAEQRQQTAAAVADRELAALQRQWQRNPDLLMKQVHELIVARLHAAAQAEQRPSAAA
jgi:hypothetical protein